MAGIYNRTLVEPKAAMFVIDSTIGQSFGEEVRPEKVDMFSRIGGRPTGATVRSPLACWAALAEDNKADEAD